jgi:hypothetical protein
VACRRDRGAVHDGGLDLGSISMSNFLFAEISIVDPEPLPAAVHLIHMGVHICT